MLSKIRHTGEVLHNGVAWIGNLPKEGDRAEEGKKIGDFDLKIISKLVVAYTTPRSLPGSKRAVIGIMRGTDVDDPVATAGTMARSLFSTPINTRRESPLVIKACGSTDKETGKVKAFSLLTHGNDYNTVITAKLSYAGPNIFLRTSATPVVDDATVPDQYQGDGLITAANSGLAANPAPPHRTFSSVVPLPSC